MDGRIESDDACMEMEMLDCLEGAESMARLYENDYDWLNRHGCCRCYSGESNSYYWIGNFVVCRMRLDITFEHRPLPGSWTCRCDQFNQKSQYYDVCKSVITELTVDCREKMDSSGHDLVANTFDMGMSRIDVMVDMFSRWVAYRSVVGGGSAEEAFRRYYSVIYDAYNKMMTRFRKCSASWWNGKAV